MLLEALKPFRVNGRMVHPPERFETDSNPGADLVRNGLAVAIKMKKVPQNKAAPANAGKSPAVGSARPSLSLPAAPALPETTPTPSECGAKRPTLHLRRPRAE